MTTIAEEVLSENQYIAKVIPVRITKDIGGERGVSRSLPEDPFETMYGAEGIIEPPYDMFTLAIMPEVSSELGPAIEAMTVNIEKLGHRVVPRDGLPRDESIFSNEVIRERARVNNFFSNAVLEPTETFTTLRTQLRTDLESTGNAYVESLPTLLTAEPAGLKHLPSWQMRLRVEDDYYTECTVPRAVQQEDGSWAIVDFPYRKRFRRFVQIREDMAKMVYFKEWGDPRAISSRTGEPFTQEELDSEDFNSGELATEVIHFKLYCPRSPYGLPRWIGNLFTIFGNRAAEVINYVTFRNNNVPALMLMATNLQLSSGSIDRIKKFVEERIQGDNNYSTILIVEGEPIGEGLRDPGTMKLEIKELTQAQHDDVMFGKYMDRNDDKIRRSFRLPPIFMGRADEYTRACYSADTETLTEYGWKNHWEISSDEKIAAFNTMTGEMRFVVPEKKHVYSVENEWMYHIHGKTTDCLITGDHKVIVRGMSSNEWREFEIRDMHYQRFDVMLAAREWCGEELESFLIPKSEHCQIERGHDHVTSYNGDDWLEFLGYFISEGGFVNGDHHGAPYYVRLSQKDPENTDKISECLHRLGIQFSSYTGDDGTTQFSISNRCLREWLTLNVGTYSYNKRIPWEYLNLSRRQLQILMDAMMLGDGTVDSREGRMSESYSTKSSELAGQVQRLLIQLGNRAVVGPGTRSLRVSFVPKQTAELRAEQLGRLPSNITQVKYTGEVYCYSVPEFGYFVTRRNGRVAIQGNTADASRKVGEEQIFRPERNHEDDIWNQTVVSGLRAANVIFRSNTPDITDNFELTQLLATAERSGGLSPHISRMIVEDMLGRDLPEISDEIDPNLPFTMTMMREQILLQPAEGGQVSKMLSDDEVLVQLRFLKSQMNESKGVTEEAHKAVDLLIMALEMGGHIEPIKALPTSIKEEEKVQTDKKDDEPDEEDEQFSEKKVINIFKANVDGEQHIVGGAVLVPGVVDLQGDIYDDEVTEAAAHHWLEHYMENPKENGIKLQHQGEVIYDAARPIQSWVLDREMTFDVEVPSASEDHPAKELTTLTYPKGTWILYARIRDEELWEMFKSGELKGWSVGGIATVQQLKKMLLAV